MNLIKPSFGRNDVDVLKRERRYQGYTAIDNFTLQHAAFQGGQTEALLRECQDKPPVVAVLPYDPVQNKVVLIEQFRVGALEDDLSPWLIEIVAGISDQPDESMEALARRELLEETGLTAEALLLMHRYWASPGASNEQVTLYCAKITSPDSGGFFGVSHEGEDIRMFVVSLDEALSLMAAGRICNSLTLIGLQWLALQQDLIGKKW